MSTSPAVPYAGLPINLLARMHHDWVGAMGWHTTNPLEKLALIASEIGEAVNEVRGATPTPQYGSELADIILRSLDAMLEAGIDPEAEIYAKIIANKMRGSKGRLK